MDSGYDNVDIKSFFTNNNILGVIGYRRYGQGNTKVRKWEFEYLKEKDVYICPKTGTVLEYKNIDRNGYKEYSNS